MENSTNQPELSPEITDYLDGIIRDKMDEGATHEEAKQATIAWLEGLATYLNKYKND